MPSLQSQAASMTGLYWVGLAWGPLLLCLLLLSFSCSASIEQPPPTQGRTPVDQGQHQGTFATAGSSKWLPMSCTLLASIICCTGHSVYLITPPPRTLIQPNKITVSTVPPPFTCHKDATTHCFLGRLSCHLLSLDVPYLLVVLLLQLPLTLLVHLLEAV